LEDVICHICTIIRSILHQGIPELIWLNVTIAILVEVGECLAKMLIIVHPLERKRNSDKLPIV
jgi:hypothetical protein